MNPELHLELNTIEYLGGKKISKDVSGKHHNAEIKGAFDLVDDPTFGRCAKCGGGNSWNDFFSVPSDDLTPNDVVTVEAWMSSGEITGGALLIEWMRNNSKTISYMKFSSPGPNMPLAGLIIPGEGGERLTQIGLGQPPILNTWYHLAAVIDGSKGTFYLHDLKGNRIGQPGNGIVQNPVNTSGRNPGAVPDELAIKGTSQLRMAHVRVYKGALSQVEIERDIASDLGAFLVDRIVGRYENHTYDGTASKNDWHYITISKVDATTLAVKTLANTSWTLKTTDNPNKLTLESSYHKEWKEAAVVWKDGAVSEIRMPHDSKEHYTREIPNLELYLELNRFEYVGGKPTFKDASGKQHSVQCISKGVPVDAVAVSDDTFGVCARLEPSTFLAVSSGDLMSNDVTVEAWVYIDESEGRDLTFKWLRGDHHFNLMFLRRRGFRPAQGSAPVKNSSTQLCFWIGFLKVGHH